MDKSVRKKMGSSEANEDAEEARRAKEADEKRLAMLRQYRIPSQLWDTEENPNAQAVLDYVSDGH